MRREKEIYQTQHDLHEHVKMDTPCVVELLYDVRRTVGITYVGGRMWLCSLEYDIWGVSNGAIGDTLDRGGVTDGDLDWTSMMESGGE